MIGWIAKMAAGKLLGGAVGKAAGIAGTAIKWPLLIAVLVWNILDDVLGLFIKSPLWIFLILILLDAIINIVLIIVLINKRNIFKLWVWDIILFGWTVISTLLGILAGWWFVDWILDPLLMAACCFLVGLLPFDEIGGGQRGSYPDEKAAAYVESGAIRKTAARRGGTHAGVSSQPSDTGNGVTINIGSVSSDALKKDS